MSTKPNRRIFALTATLFVMLFATLSVPLQVFAAQVAEATPNSCLTCHEDLYYLHDMGKYYCITEHKDRCVSCHEGNTAAMKKEESHAGLIAHPQGDNGAKCQECHAPQVAQTRLVKFASVGGFDTVIQANVYTPSSEVSSGFPDIPEANPLLENLPWLAGALVLFGLWLILVLFSPQKP
jgi:hypothetical protein